MAAYKDLVGQKVTVVTSNPPEPKTGQMWYNSTTGTLKGLGLVEAWISASPMTTAMDQLGGTGTQTAALAGAGGGLSTFEEYDGSGWAAGGSIPTAMELIAQLAGTQTAAICKGGLTPPPGGPTGRFNNEAYTYDGSSWSSITDSGDARIRGAASGTQTAFFVAGGASGPPTFTNRLNSSEEYDGSSWTEGGSMSTAREFLSGFGTQTASIMAGGAVPPSYGNSNASEQYDGTSFSSTPNINTARYGLTGSGTSTSNLIYGGGTGSNSAATESYDGTSWSNKPSMATARIYLTRAGDSSSSGLASAGNSGSAVGTTEEFNSSTNTITAAAWSSAATLPESKYTNAGAGTSTAALNWGGFSPISSTTVEFDGSSWGSGGAYPKGIASHGGTGLQTAALSVGGLNPASPPAYNDSFEYDGTSWGSPATYPQYGFGTRVWGIQTSAVATGGGNYPAPTYNTTTANSYNGTSWTSETAFSTLRSFHTNGGANDTAGIIMGGRSAPGTETAIKNTEEYNGSSWTAGGDYITVNKECAGWGIQTDLMQAGGSVPSATATCAIYDGTAWATTASLPAVLTLNATTQGTFNTNSGFTLGGSSGGATNAVSEFTPESTAVNITDFSTS